MRPIVGGNFGGNIESGEYAVCLLSGHIFGRETLLSSGPTYYEAAMPAGDEYNFVLSFSTVVPRFGVGEYVQTDENG